MADTCDALLFSLGTAQPLPQLSLHTLLHKMTPDISHLVDTMSFMAQMLSGPSAPAPWTWAGELMHSVHLSSARKYLVPASCLSRRGM